MSVRNLSYLFKPQSVALIGASSRPYSVGATVLRNLIDGGFKGTIFPVNPKYRVLSDLPVFHRVDDLPEAPDLAIICTPPASVPDVISALALKGTKAAIVLTAGLGSSLDRQGRTLKQAMLDAARPSLLRVLGPNCVGLLVPGIGLNASFAHTNALPGRIAFVSQSGALVTGILDWAKSRGIGFSTFISLGDSADVDVGDVLDYLASDSETHAILLYVEDIRHARKFMSAARAAARSKPTLIIKAGRQPEGARAAASHTGALAGSDAVYDAAIRRAGMLRVLSTAELFGAVETLAYARPLDGDRLAILTNGGGPGVMATDALMDGLGTMAALAPSTIDALDAVLPSTWSHGNPIDIIGDAAPQRYAQALEILFRDPLSDAILMIHAPTAIASSAAIASALVPLAQRNSRTLLTCWLGGAAVAEARQICASAGIPVYDTPEDAVKGFLQLVQYRRNQNLLMQVPPAIAAEFVPDRAAAQALIARALAAGRTALTEPEAKALLAAYGIPVVDTRIASDAEAAARLARAIGFPVALKILSVDVVHKSDVGGVALDLADEDAVRTAASVMLARLGAMLPAPRVEGFTVQAMVRRPQAHELIVGVSTDPVFGPVILFGQGGIAVEVLADHAIGLPPLNAVLARDMVAHTRVAKLLAGYRNRAPADIEAICRTLVQISQMVIDLPSIVELDINPLLADAGGVLALDARVLLGPIDSAGDGLDRLAIRPYPQALEETVTWCDRPLLVRPIRPEDGSAHVAFFNALAPDDVRYRMFIRMRELSLSQLARFTQIDYDREMAFIATRQRPDGAWETLGVARVIADPDNRQAEFAIIVRSDLKQRGLGTLLMKKLIAYCRSRGTAEIIGDALQDNAGLLKLARGFGFTVQPMLHDGIAKLSLMLLPAARLEQ